MGNLCFCVPLESTLTQQGKLKFGVWHRVHQRDCRAHSAQTSTLQAGGTAHCALWGRRLIGVPVTVTSHFCFTNNFSSRVFSALQQPLGVANNIKTGTTRPAQNTTREGVSGEIKSGQARLSTHPLAFTRRGNGELFDILLTCRIRSKCWASVPAPCPLDGAAYPDVLVMMSW